MKLWLLNRNRANVMPIDEFESLIWTERYSEYGDFELCLPSTKEFYETIQEGFFVWADFSSTLMLVETKRIENDAEDGDRLIISGRSLESILDRRIIWKVTRINAYLENGINRIITENFHDTKITARAIPDLVFVRSTDSRITGLRLEAQYTGQVIYTVIKEICDSYGLGFKVTFNESSNKFELRLFCGNDHSYAQNENYYVVFSESFDNLGGTNVLESSKTLKNVALVAGENKVLKGANKTKTRRARIVGDSKGIDRRELFVDARDIQSEKDDGSSMSTEEYYALLDQRGYEKLSDNTRTSSFEAKIEASIDTFVYGVDYNMGDIVQIINEVGIEREARVTEYIRSWDQSGYKEYPTFTVIEDNTSEKYAEGDPYDVYDPDLDPDVNPDLDPDIAPSTTVPKMDGTAAVGTEINYARGDHVHPHDTSKVDKVSGKGLSANDFTDALKSKLEKIPDPDPSTILQNYDRATFMTPSAVYNVGTVNTQGMTGDGTYLYITTRSDWHDNVVMNIAKVPISTMTIQSTHALSTGHYNSLCYYNGVIYATAAGLNSSGSPDYSIVGNIDPSTLSLTRTYTNVENWGIGIREFRNSDKKKIRGDLTAFYKPDTRDILYYAGYVDASSSHQRPLASITLEYTGSTTVQGSMHLTKNYIWLLETCYNAATRESGYQVVRCFSYSGMLVRSFYIEKVTEELEDLYVTENERKIYINGVSGKVYRLDILAMYHVIPTSPEYPGIFKAGTIKHVYANYGPLDTWQKFTRNGSNYYVYPCITVSDYMYLKEIAKVLPIHLKINGESLPGQISNDYSTITFGGQFLWASGSFITYHIVFSRKTNSSGNNYQYYISSVLFRTRDTSNSSSKTYSETSSDGDISVQTSGMGLAFYELYRDGWLFGDLAIEEISYVCGLSNGSTSINLIR